MVGSLFNPASSSQPQMRPAPAHLFLQRQHSSPALLTQQKTKMGLPPPPPSKPARKKPVELTRTTSTPSTTTAPMFPDQILENLYISDLETARAVLSPNYCSPGRPQIKYVLTLLDNAKEQPQSLTATATEKEHQRDYVLKLIKLSDFNDVNLLQILPEACAFIRSSLAQNDGGVLVHCRKGISRSGSVVVAFLMQELGIGFEDALGKAKAARNKIWPNRGFSEQLRLWRELNYALVDENGLEKDRYVEWRLKTRFRPEVWEF